MKQRKCAVCKIDIDANLLCDGCARCPGCGQGMLVFGDIVECFHCGLVYENKNIYQIHKSILERYKRFCVKCGNKMNKFVPDNKPCLCEDCLYCLHCGEQLDFRNDKLYCWFCDEYWLPKSLLRSAGCSKGHHIKRCDNLEQEYTNNLQNNLTFDDLYSMLRDVDFWS